MKLNGLRFVAGVVALAICGGACWAQEKRKVIIDQDAAGPAGTDLQSTLLLIQSPDTEVLGITVVTGDMWLNSEVAHTLRMLELIGRTDIPRGQRSGVSTGSAEGRDRTSRAAIWSVRMAGSMDTALVPSAGSVGRHAGGQADDEGDRRGRCPFPAAHGSQVSARSDDLRGRPHDQPRAGNLYRSGIRRTGQGTGFHGRQFKPVDR